MEVISVLAPTLILLAIGYIAGRQLETKHFRLLMAGEQQHPEMLVITVEDFPEEWRVEQVHVVIGNVVISLDYYKRIIATFRAIIGGSIREYEPLLARARREALLRMKTEAIEMGFDHVVNVRIETARLASGRRDGKGTAGVEIVAYGTALKLAS